MSQPLTKLETILPRATDRAVFVGKTGSGKTTLARKVLSYFQHVVIYDAKGLIKWDGYKRYTKLAEVVKSTHKRILYAPRELEMPIRDPDFVEAFFRWVYLRRYCVVYVDELTAIARGSELPASYHDVLARGRERGIGCFSATQRPKRIPLNILSEAEHFYTFRLTLEPDRKRVEEITGIDADEIAGMPEHIFYHTSETTQSGRLKLSQSEVK